MKVAQHFSAGSCFLKRIRPGRDDRPPLGLVQSHWRPINDRFDRPCRDRPSFLHFPELRTGSRFLKRIRPGRDDRPPLRLVQSHWRPINDRFDRPCRDRPSFLHFPELRTGSRFLKRIRPGRDDRPPLRLVKSHWRPIIDRFDRPCGTGRLFLHFSQHFVLGYFHGIPPGLIALAAWHLSGTQLHTGDGQRNTTPPPRTHGVDRPGAAANCDPCLPLSGILFADSCPLELQQFLRNFPAIFRDLLDHGLVQPDVHRGGIVCISGVMQLFRKLDAGGKTAVHSHQFHQINNGLTPIQFFGILRSQAVENRGYIHHWWRSRGWRSRGAGRRINSNWRI